MVEQAQLRTNRFQLVFWQWVIQILTTARSCYFWMRGHFLGAVMIILAAILLLVTATSFPFDQLSNLPFINLSDEKEEQKKSNNYLVLLYDDLSAENLVLKNAWMVFQTNDPKPVKMVTSADQPELNVIANNMTLMTDDQSQEAITAWMKQQNMDLGGYLVLDMAGLSDLMNSSLPDIETLVGIGTESGFDEMQVLNLWCIMYQTTDHSGQFASLSKALSNGNLVLFDGLASDTIFPEAYNTDLNSTLPICQVIQ